MAPFGGGALAGLSDGRRGPSRRNPLMTLLLPFAVMVAGNILGSVLSNLLSPMFMALGGLISLVGSVWYLLLAITMANEVKAVTRNEAFVWWPILIPIYGCYWLWVLVPQEVLKAKRTLGIDAPVRSILLYVFVWPFAWASDLNDMAR
jgi:hypothetical protein